MTSRERALRDMVVYLETTTRQPITKTEWYCINCGAKGLWAEGVRGAHTGLYGCTSCHESYRMDNWVEVPMDTYAVAVLAVHQRKRK